MPSLSANVYTKPNRLQLDIAFIQVIVHCRTFLLDRYSMPWATCHPQHMRSLVEKGALIPGTLPTSWTDGFPLESNPYSPMKYESARIINIWDLKSYAMPTNNQTRTDRGLSYFLCTNLAVITASESLPYIYSQSTYYYCKNSLDCAKVLTNSYDAKALLTHISLCTH